VNRYPCEFDCAECHRHVVRFVRDEADKPTLCFECVAVPGWFRDPVLVRILDPEYKRQ
jgi:hypothetical protein